MSDLLLFYPLYFSLSYFSFHVLIWFGFFSYSVFLFNWLSLYFLHIWNVVIIASLMSLSTNSIFESVLLIFLLMGCIFLLFYVISNFYCISDIVNFTLCPGYFCIPVSILGLFSVVQWNYFRNRLLYLFVFSEMGSHSCHPGWSAVVASWLTAASTSPAQAKRPPKCPK